MHSVQNAKRIGINSLTNIFVAEEATGLVPAGSKGSLWRLIYAGQYAAGGVGGEECKLCSKWSLQMIKVHAVLTTPKQDGSLFPNVLQGGGVKWAR